MSNTPVAPVHSTCDSLLNFYSGLLEKVVHSFKFYGKMLDGQVSLTISYRRVLKVQL